jgi:hypothetical protein
MYLEIQQSFTNYVLNKLLCSAYYMLDTELSNCIRVPQKNGRRYIQELTYILIETKSQDL